MFKTLVLFPLTFLRLVDPQILEIRSIFIIRKPSWTTSIRFAVIVLLWKPDWRWPEGVISSCNFSQLCSHRCEPPPNRPWVSVTFRWPGLCIVLIVASELFPFFIDQLPQTCWAHHAIAAAPQRPKQVREAIGQSSTHALGRGADVCLVDPSLTGGNWSGGWWRLNMLKNCCPYALLWCSIELCW